MNKAICITCIACILLIAAFVTIEAEKSDLFKPVNAYELRREIDRVRGETLEGKNMIDLNYIDTSDISDMGGLFMKVDFHNFDVSQWDVSNVTNMSSMFHGAGWFNSDISSWNVSKVTDMSNMFSEAYSFNADISGWDVSKVTDMSNMFYFSNTVTYAFSSKAQCKERLGKNYAEPSFNADISSWDVSNVTNMRFMFLGANAFTHNLEQWHEKLQGREVDIAYMFKCSGVRNLPTWYTP